MTSLGTAYIEVEPDFDAFDRRVTAAMPMLSSRMSSLSRSSDKARTTTSRLGTATAGLGSVLGTAAVAAAGAAAAYISITQAKAAISTTTDLAKVTAGLSRNLGLSTKAASRWGAVAYARDIDTKSLTMSFTTLSRQLTEASRGSDTATQAFKDIGITQRDLKSTNGDFQKQLMLVAEGFGEAEGGAKRQQAAQKLLGRGYQTLLPLFAEGRDSLKEQLHWADKYGVTLDKKTTKSVMDFVSAQRESRVAWLGLQKNFSVAVMPLLKDAQEQFQHLAHIVNNPKLSPEEKWDKATRAVGHLIKKWGGKLLEFAANLGADFFAAIWDSIDADVDANGDRYAAQFANGLIDVLNAANDKLAEVGVGNVPIIGDALQRVFSIGLPHLPVPDAEAVDATLDGVKALDHYAKAATAAIKVLERLNDAQDRSGNHTDKARDKMQSYGRGTEETARLASRSMGDHALKIDKYSDYIRKDLDRGKDKARDYADGTGDSYDKSSDAAKRMAKRVGGSAKSLADAVRGGMENIAENTNEALKGFNVKKLSFSFKNVGGAASDLGGFQTGGVIVPGRGTGDIFGPVGLQPGSVVVNRKATAAMLEPGEMVLDPPTVRSYFGSAEKADRINKLIPRFAKGGKVGGMAPMISLVNKYERASYPYNWGGGHGGFPGGTIPVDCSGFVSDVLHAGGLLQGAPMVSGALMNWGKPGKGPVTVYASPSHTVMSLNGRFAGTSGSNPGGGAGWIENGSPGLVPGGVARTMGAIAAEIARVILRGPDGPLKDIGQKALDRVRGAANKFIASKAPMGALGGGDLGPLGKAIVTGRATWFTGGTMASGKNTDTDPGIALNPNPGGPDPSSWNNPTTQRWLADAQQFLVKIGGKQAALPVLDMGPAGWTGNAIDVDRAGVSRLGFSTSSFPSGTVGTAQAIKRQLGGIIGLQKGGDPKKDGKPIGGAAHGMGTDPDFKRLRHVRRIMKRIAELIGEKGKAARLEETIGRVESLAGLESSPMGSELSPAELARQIALNEKLLETLTRARKLTGSGLRLANRKPYSEAGDKQFRGVRANLGQTMLDLAGLTGKGGRIFDAKLHLDELRHTTTGTGALAAMDISGLRSVIEAARYGVFDSQLPRFHEGGTYRAPAGRNEGAAILSDGERVSPPGAGVVVNNNFDFEGLDLIVTTTVNGEIAKRERLRHNRARQYQR